MTDVSTALPDLILAPETTVTVTLDDVNAKVTKLNVYGFTPASDDAEPVKPYKPPYIYGAAQQLDVLAVTTWPDVGLALVVALPGLTAAYYAARAAEQARRANALLKTPSGTSIGKQVEDTQHTAIANNYRLQAMGAEFDVPMPDKASDAESRVEALNDVKTRAQRRPHG